MCTVSPACPLQCDMEIGRIGQGGVPSLHTQAPKVCQSGFAWRLQPERRQLRAQHPAIHPKLRAVARVARFYLVGSFPVSLP